MTTTLSHDAIQLAALDGLLANDERNAQRLIEAMREKQRELHRIQKEQKALATRLLTCQRQIAATSDQIANILARRRG